MKNKINGNKIKESNNRKIESCKFYLYKTHSEFNNCSIGKFR